MSTDSVTSRALLDRHPLSRPGRILLLLIAIVSTAMIGVVCLYYNNQKAANEEAAQREVFAVAEVEATQILNWRRERLGDGHLLMSSSLIRLAEEELASRALTGVEHAQMLDLMTRLTDSFDYSDIILADSDGSVVERLHNTDTKESPLRQSIRRSLSQQSIQAKDVILSNLFPNDRTNGPLMGMALPVGKLGALILVIDPARFLYPFLRNWPGPRQTAESLLEGRDGDEATFLSPFRFPTSNRMFTPRRISLRLPDIATLDAGWAVRAKDYRGVPVIGAIRHITGTSWYLVCKIDFAEVDAPIHRLGWEMAVLAVLIGLAAIVGGGSVYRAHQARFLREREEWFFSAANDTPALLWMTSPTGRGIFINNPFRKFLGLPENGPIEGEWEKHIHPEDRAGVVEQYRDAASQKRPWMREFRLRRFDGEYRTVFLEAAPRFSPHVDFLGFSGSVKDITEQRAAQQDLQEELEERTRREEEIRSLSARLMQAREDERRYLALELHDDVNQRLAAVNMGIANLRRQIPAGESGPESQSALIHRQLIHVTDAIRRISHDLHPAILEIGGLSAAIRSCCAEFRALTKIQIEFAANGDFSGIFPGVSLALYRIAQEALQNVAKHADAQSARVELDRLDGVLRLTISDSGKGISPSTAKAGVGLGLLGIRERARLVDGEVVIRSAPNEGTTLTVRVNLGASGALVAVASPPA